MTSLDLIKYIKSLGVSDIGFSNVEELVPDNWKEYKYAITVAIQLSHGIVDDIVDKPTETYFSHYRSVNYHINEIGLKTTIELQNNGYKAIAIPASQSLYDKPYYGVFPHKTAATLSGLGWIGKSNLFVHERLGPRLRLGTILTNMELLVGKPVTTSRCNQCNLCAENCPAMAIEGVNWHQGMRREDLYNAHACSSYMKEHFQHIGRGAVCGICISSCPIGKE